MLLPPNVIHILLLFLILFVNWTRGFHVFSSSSGTTANQPMTSPHVHITKFSNYWSTSAIDGKKKDYDDGANAKTNNDKKYNGVIFIAPFVFLFGLDLVLNIAVITKRSLEVLITGEYTVWTPWQ